MAETSLPDVNAPANLLRRASIRYRCDQNPTRRIFLVESYKSLSVGVHDLALGGVGLICDRSIPVGTYLFIDLMNMDFPMETLAHVVHATPRSGGDWLIGCEFQRSLTREELTLALGR